MHMRFQAAINWSNRFFSRVQAGWREEKHDTSEKLVDGPVRRTKECEYRRNKNDQGQLNALTTNKQAMTVDPASINLRSDGEQSQARRRSAHAQCQQKNELVHRQSAVVQKLERTKVEHA